METRDTLRKIAALPPEARTIVFDLIEALEKRYATQAAKAKTGSQMKNLRADPFVGMWRDRDDMADAAQYVHNLRRNEWQRDTRKP